MSLRQRINRLRLGKEQRVLVDNGIMYPSGSLTKEGRKVVLDELFRSDVDLQARIVVAISQLDETSE